MQRIKKIVQHGKSRGINLPADWLKYIERKTGNKLIEVTITEEDDFIKIKPVLNETTHGGSS